MPTEQQIRDVWVEHRPYLLDLAFRMLGDIGRAEDAVQEAFQRLSRSDYDGIQDARGWLIVVTSRICLDVIRSARNRRERPVSEEHLLARVDGGSGGLSPGGAAIDPADRVTLDDSVRLALLVVLERLSPAERVAFVLHDIFGLPFDTVAETVGRPEASCRQLARRARLKLEAPEGGRSAVVTPDQHRVVTERFIAACANGNFADLLAVLDPDVTGGVDIRPGLVVHGADAVASNLVRYWGWGASLVSLPNVDNPCVVAFADRDVAALLSLTVTGDRISKVHVYAAPEALAFLRERVLPAS
jgi:RNA polymerase sigma-70 factor (ECF subfamily)